MTLMENASRVKHGDRKVTYDFDGPAVEVNAGDSPMNKRVKVIHEHDKERREYTTMISECIAGTSGMFAMERFELGRDFLAVCFREPVARYSERTFNEFCKNVNAIIDAVVAGTVSGDRLAPRAVELLMSAQDFAAAAVN